jgi:hypothetical protein
MMVTFQKFQLAIHVTETKEPRNTENAGENTSQRNNKTDLTELGSEDERWMNKIVFSGGL